VPGHDTTTECQYLGFQRQQLGAGNAGPRRFRDPAVIWMRDNFEQLLDAIATNGFVEEAEEKVGKYRGDAFFDVVATYAIMRTWMSAWAADPGPVGLVPRIADVI
jgi:hypothetical protein